MSGLREAAVRLRVTADTFQATLRRACLSLGLEAEGHTKKNATTAPKVRRGTLRRSIKGGVETVVGGLEIYVSAGGGVADHYAAAQEDGATIRPRNGRFLAIPVGAALTASGVPRYRSPRQVAGLRFVSIRGGAMGLLVRAGGKKGERAETLFVLVTSSRIPATHYLKRAMERIRPHLAGAVGTALGGGNA